MKIIIAICFFFLSTQLYSQGVDSISKETNEFNSISTRHYSNKAGGSQGSMLSVKGEKPKKLVIKNDIIFTTYNFQLSPIENEISDLEALECKALLKRDTSILKTLWARDFTLDESPNKILTNGKNPLPYYTSLSRMVENFSVMDDVVFTSGYESSQQLKANGGLEDSGKVNYFHTWTRKNGVWQLTRKTHN